MTVREFAKCDKSELLEMMKEFYASPALLHHTPESVLAKVIDDCVSPMPNVKGYVCTDEGGICGYTIVSIGYSTEYGGISVMIEDLFVKGDRRGLGAGSALLDFVEREYKKLGAVRLRLEVEPNNLSAIKLYGRCGFTEVGYLQMDKLL